jgi:hypothetical protein
MKMSPLDSEQRAHLAAYWWRRAEGEMTSWVGFRHVLSDLRAEGSPPPVIALAERAVDDERRHALWCRDWAEQFGHPADEVRPRTERPVIFPSATENENRLLRIALCCFTESVGCFILRHARAVISDPDLRRFNRRHLADELQHSRVGWGHLATLDDRRRDFLRGWIPELLRLLPTACCDGPEADREDLVPFGYFTPRLLCAAHDEAVREVIVPGLEYVGLGSPA